jgi:antitoxin VapB
MDIPSETSMTAIRTKTFRSGNSQAVRLPKAVAFADDTELEVTRQGDVVTLRPVSDRLARMWALLEALPAPGEIEVRDLDEIPEPRGL